MRFALFLATSSVVPVARAEEPESSGSGDSSVVAPVPVDVPNLSAKVRLPSVRAPLEDVAASASVVGADRPARAVEALPDVLGEVPGLFVSRLGGYGAFATVSLRGSTPDQVRVYLDGIPLNQAAGGAVDLSAIPVGDVDRIEVYRGVTPIAFGESALGGIVSVTTREATSGAPPHVTAELGGGSFGMRLGGATVSLSPGPLKLYAGLHARASENDFAYVSDLGTTSDPGDDVNRLRTNAGSAELDATVRGTLEIAADRVLRFGLLGFGRDQGVPGDGKFQTRDASLSTRRGLAFLTWEDDALGPGWKWRARLFGAGMQQRFVDTGGEIVPGRRTETEDLTRSLGASTTLQLPATSWLSFTGLLEGRVESFQPLNKVETVPVGAPAERAVAALGVESRIELDSLGLLLLPSLRAELSRDVTSGRNTWGRPLPASEPVGRVLPVARLGAVKKLSDSLSLRLNGGRYARLPSTTELYGDTGFLFGNPALRPETGLNADLGLTYREKLGDVRIEGELAAFGAIVDDLIQWRLFTQNVAVAQNVSKARVAGVESALRVWWRRSLGVVAQLTFTDARDDGEVPSTAGKLLPGRPQWRAYLRPEWKGVDVGPLEISLFSELDFTGGNYRTNTNTGWVEPRWLLGGGLSVGHAASGVRLVLNSQNWLDTRVNDFNGFPLPGRSFFATLQGSFDVGAPAVTP